MHKHFFARTPLLFYIFVLVLGSWVRLDQFLSQILIDDEWHSIHQIILHSPRDILMSFGYTDHSIPLTLLYWTESSWIGLSELGMRWPMMLSGLATLVLFPWYVWRTVGQREAVLFALLLAISPMLVVYSQTARPYSVTLLFVYVAHFAFYRYCSNTTHRLAFGVLYGVTAVLATWMHLIVGPFVVAPFLLEGIAILRASAPERLFLFRRMLLLGVPTAIGMLLFILPPLVANFDVIGAKSSIDSPNWQTIVGAWHLWIGSPSTMVVLVFLVLALIGAPRLLRELMLIRSALLGLALTLAVILVTKPAWVHHSVTFGRYLLPAIPLLLLFVAAGSTRLADVLVKKIGPMRKVMATAVLVIPILLLALQSPLDDMLRRPNTNLTHSIFSFDFRPGHNLIMNRAINDIPLSSYWSQLASRPRDSLRIAVAPFYFESYNWDAPRWERISGQTIIPAYLSGLCVDWRLGEIPNIERFKFRNAVFLSDRENLATHKVDLIAYQKPYTAKEDNNPQNIIGKETSNCENALRNRFGGPRYEDDKIIVFSFDVTSKMLGHVK
jgi:hypothetical protein